MLLKDMNIGEICRVEHINLPLQIERRLRALGMTTQTELTVINRKGKGIMIIKLRGTKFAIGYQMAKNIRVNKVGKRHE